MKPVKFFCEFCGHQVRANDKICSHCGSFFTKVRCPSCSFEGDAGLFTYGCPACGYVDPEAEGKGLSVKAQKDPRSQRVTFDMDDVIPRPKTKKPFVPSWALWLLFAVAFVASIAVALSLQGSR